ncbi:MAG: response regulator, partial [Prochlorothrix sp.]
LDWLIVTTLPSEGFQQVWGQSLLGALGLGGLVCLAVGGTGYWVVRQIERPLEAAQRDLQSLLHNQVPEPITASSSLTLIQTLIKDLNDLGVKMGQQWASSQEQEQRSNLLLENLPVGMGLWDGAGKLLFLNRKGRQLLGLEPAIGPSHGPEQAGRSAPPLPNPLPPLFYVAGQPTPVSLQDLPGFAFTPQQTQKVLRNVEIKHQGQRVPLAIKMQWIVATAIPKTPGAPNLAPPDLAFPGLSALDWGTPWSNPPAGEATDRGLSWGADRADRPVDPSQADRPANPEAVDPSRLYQVAIFENMTFQRQLEQLQQTHEESLRQQLKTLEDRHQTHATLIHNLLELLQICVVRLEINAQSQVTVQSVSPQSCQVFGYSPEQLQANPQLWYENIAEDDRATLVDPYLQAEAWRVPGSSPLVTPENDTSSTATGSSTAQPDRTQPDRAPTPETAPAPTPPAPIEASPLSPAQPPDRLPVPSLAPTLSALNGFETFKLEPLDDQALDPRASQSPITTQNGPACYRFQKPDGSHSFVLSRYRAQWNPSTQCWSIEIFSLDVTQLRTQPAQDPASTPSFHFSDPTAPEPEANESALAQFAAQLQQLHQEKEQAERHSRAKSEFLATLSHDIRTLLSGIVGMAELALKTELTSQQHHYLDRIQGSSHNLLSLLNDLLDLSKIESGRFALENTCFSLEQVLTGLTDLRVLKNNRKDLELLIDVASNVPPYLQGDSLRLSQILTNLVSNALKFTEQGEVVVSAETISSTDHTLTIQFAVRDTGIGLSPPQQQRLFEAFQQADIAIARQYGGTGLGLYICHQLVEMMGGTLGIDSEVGRGSLFWFTVVLGQVDPKDYPQEADHQSALANLRVLVVDDSPLATRVLNKMLRGYGAQPTLVQGGGAAIASLTTALHKQEPFDVILLDQRMPEMDGLAVADYLQRHPDLLSRSIIIMMTGYSLQEVSVRAKALGINYVLSKPIQGPKLLETVLAAIGQSCAIDPAASAASAPSVPPVPIAPLLHRDATSASRVNLVPQGFKPILLVEDNPINQELTLALLEQMNLGADVANDGAQALQKLRQNRYDLVLMDCQMPVMDGFEATIQIRQDLRWQNLPIVALTANVLRGDRERCLAVGMNDYLPKPIDHQRFQAILRRWLPQLEDPTADQAATVTITPVYSRSEDPSSAAPPILQPSPSAAASATPPTRSPQEPQPSPSHAPDPEPNPAAGPESSLPRSAPPSTAPTSPAAALTSDLTINPDAAPDATPDAAPDAASDAAPTASNLTADTTPTPIVPNPPTTTPNPAPPKPSRDEELETSPNGDTEFQELTRANLTLALEQLGYNRALYRKLLYRFLDRYLSFTESFQHYQADIDKDPLGPTRFAHTLKGNAATLGFETLQARAYDLEQICRTQAIHLAHGTEIPEQTIVQVQEALEAVTVE